MQDIFKKIYRVSLASSVLFLIFGLFLIFQTQAVIKTVSMIIGLLLLIIGIFPIINYFRNRFKSFFTSAGLLYGIFSVVAGIIIMVNHNLLATIIPALTGVWMIVNSVNKIQLSMQLRDNNVSNWLITFIFAILILIGGAFLIVNPFNGAVILSKTVGIIIVIYSVLDIADSILIRTKSKEIKNCIIEVKEVIEKGNKS